RIGRTGRAGRSGEAILFVTPRERGMLRAIERATRQPIEQMELPSVDAVNERRVAKFMERIGTGLQADDLGQFRELVERYESEHDVPAIEIAAALAKQLQGDTPLLLEPPKERPKPARFDDAPRQPGKYADAKPGRKPRPPAEIGTRPPEVGMETFRIEVGHSHGVQPGNIVGAIANEADLESRYIGRIDIRDDYTLVDLPEGMPREILELLKKVRVGGQQLRMRRAEAADTDATAARGKRPFQRKPHRGKPPHPRKPVGKPRS